jgi:sarcosine oxidase
MYDVAVIGLGAMGAMTTWRARARGARVLGIERFTPGHDRGSSHGGSRIFRRTLFEGPAYVPLIGRAAPLWRRLAEESATTLFQRSGGLSIGPPGGEFLRAAARAAEEGGAEHLLLDPDELTARHPQHAPAEDGTGDGAVFEPGAGVLDPEAAIRAAAGLASAAGADLRFGTRVTALHAEDDGVRIELGGEVVRAARAVVATGAWFTDLVPGLDLPLRAQRSPLLHFTGPDRARYRPDRFPVFVRKNATLDVWGIPDVDGRGVKLGAGPTTPKPWLDHADDNALPLTAADTAAVEDLCRRGFPGLDPHVATGRPCMNSRTPDRDFVLGRPAAAPRLVLAGGFSGHGFKYAAGIGDVAADLALDGGTDTPLDPFAPDRFARAAGR